MYDAHDRQINYLRVSVTDRCNFRCAYCMPTQGVQWLAHDEILTYEELLRVIKIVSHYGVSRIRLTGGEPLIRKGIVEFIESIANLNTITDLSLTTNGSLLASMGARLKEAGLNRVNISLDTVDPAKFKKVTRGGNVSDTLKGIETALAVGLTPVKINVVLTNIITERDITYFVNLVQHEAVSVRFIEYMPIGESPGGQGPSVDHVKPIIKYQKRGILKPTLDIHGSGPAKYYYLPKAKGSFGFITPISDHFCNQCNRIRLTADGKFKPCLLSNQEVDVKAALRGGVCDDEIAKLFFETITIKPQGHNLGKPGESAGFFRKMSQIGG